MSLTIGRIERTGRVNFGDASLSIWEEGISSARAVGGHKGAQKWEQEFKRDVFARIVQTLRRLGWACVVPDEYIKQYSLSFARDRRSCTKGDLKGWLEISGRCIRFETWQSINTPTRPDHGGKYESNKEGVMPYLLRLEMERTRRRIRDYLCNVFTEYKFEPPAPKLGINGVTALEYAAHSRRTSGHYVAELDRARISNTSQGFSADGFPLENGTMVYAEDYHGRVICGAAFYSLNGNWQVVTGRYNVTYAWHTAIWVNCPGDPRIKRNARQRRKRLESELSKAVAAMNFERASILRDILFPGGPAIFNVWHGEHQLYHCAEFCGYTSDQSKAGKFTADEVRGWDCAPNKVMPMATQAAV